jgi:hypothetical protein
VAEAGFVLWGASWAEPLAESMQIPKEDVIGMDVKPAAIRRLMEQHLQYLGEKGFKKSKVCCV